GLGARLRQVRTVPYRAPVPVICVGNLVSGGAGKTPVAMAIADILAEMGLKPAFLSKGFGGDLHGPVMVSQDEHDSRAVGDEPLLLAARHPCWVARDRVTGAQAAMKAGATALVMDDGFQNPALVKDMALIVVDGATGFGNGRLIPAGPLREPVQAGLARADAVIRIGDDIAGVCDTVGDGCPVLTARLVPDRDAAAFAGRKVYAFAGIGLPEKFHATLEEIGAKIVGWRPFPDHHRYTVRQIKSMVFEAGSLDAKLVTTAKDAVRLPYPEEVGIVRVNLDWDDASAIKNMIAEKIGAA
ncbi:MAG: tetraacyldisaccharide 4'-kinase, partial [Pseudomonadota bacterium]|nr:tetraacyldisaccharide 4'-kinase [Pseudomonadota bacterium]